MRDLTHDSDRLRRVVLVIVALGITLLFLGMISEFLIALLLAALAAGILRPLYRRLVQRFRGRRTLASGLSVALLFFLGIGPVVVFAIIVGIQAVDVAEAVGAVRAFAIGAEIGLAVAIAIESATQFWRQFESRSGTTGFARAGPLRDQQLDDGRLERVVHLLERRREVVERLEALARLLDLLLRVGEADVLAILESGDLKGKKIGSAWRIRRAAIDEYLAK